MEKYQGHINSKLPNTGTSIFAVMSQMAQKHNAINLSQGFPDFPVSKTLIDRIHYYMGLGYNQYAPMQGVFELREQISIKAEKLYAAKYNPETEVTICAGATEAIFSVITALIKEDDEAIIFEPAYDCYAPAIKLNGGMVKHAHLRLPDYSIDWEELPRMINHRTRLIIINTPHNPTGSVLKAEDLKKLESLIRGTEILILSDEVYEHIIFDGLKHESVSRYPDLASRSFVIGSFGKTFHATGWKMGFVLAPENLMAEFRKAHQFIVYAVNTPIQYAIADYLKDAANYENISQLYEEKRDFFCGLIQNSRFKIIPSFGTYFQLLDYKKISDEKEMDFASRLITEYGIAAIPISPFYLNKMESQRLRFCFAKSEETLTKAAEILCRI